MTVRIEDPTSGHVLGSAGAEMKFENPGPDGPHPPPEIRNLILDVSVPFANVVFPKPRLSDSHPHSGKACMRCDFEAGAGWGGVTWQNPAGDWGDRSGGYDLTGAKKLTFRARGENGGEIVSFEFGTLAKPKKFFDTGHGKLERVSLTKDWQRHEIDVSAQDLTRIKTGFVWTLASPGQPVTFYLDDVRWE